MKAFFILLVVVIIIGSVVALIDPAVTQRISDKNADTQAQLSAANVKPQTNKYVNVATGEQIPPSAAPTNANLDENKATNKSKFGIQCSDIIEDEVCIVDIDSDYQASLYFEDTSVDANVISVLINSPNFELLLQDMLAEKVSNASYELETRLNQALNQSLVNSSASSNGVSCGEEVCGLVLENVDAIQVESVQDKLLSAAPAGSVFMFNLSSDSRLTQRILFFPNKSVVVRPYP